MFVSKAATNDRVNGFATPGHMDSTNAFCIQQRETSLRTDTRSALG